MAVVGVLFIAQPTFISTSTIIKPLSSEGLTTATIATVIGGLLPAFVKLTGGTKESVHWSTFQHCKNVCAMVLCLVALGVESIYHPLLFSEHPQTALLLIL